MIPHRGALLGRRAALAGAAALALSRRADAAAPLKGPSPSDWRALEARLEGGRLGAYALNVATGASLGWRADERFAMCSTFKLLLAGAVLSRVDAGRERLDRKLPITRDDLRPHAPVVERHLAEGSADVETLCAAAVQVSDNSAANLLLRTLGGPRGLTRYIRTLGDRTTRLDRWEVELNSAIPGDVRDTTTPGAMTGSCRTLLTGRALSPASRERLAGWRTGAATGLTRIRQGLPAGWRAGDKTGAGSRNTINDVAVAWPPSGGPLFVTVYTTGGAAPQPVREAVMAEIGRQAAQALV